MDRYRQLGDRRKEAPASGLLAASSAPQRRPQALCPRIDSGSLPSVLPLQRVAWATSMQRTVGNRATVEMLEAHSSAARGGEPLPQATRALLEPRFGYDFGQVRVHTGREAAEAARAVQARAYTLGQDIVFGRGQYAPETQEGRRLLAHELTHVVQQSGASTAVQPSLEVDEASSPLEQEANRAADAVLRGDDANVSGSVPLRLSREKDAGPEAAAATCPVDSKGTLSQVSWGESSGLYPTTSSSASVLYNPSKWDAAKVCDILAMRNGIHTVGGRGQRVHKASPKKNDPVEQKLAKYHYIENFQPAPLVTEDPKVKWFYLSNASDKPASHPSLPGSIRVVSYGSFYNSGGGDVPKGNTWVHFYKAKP